MSIGFKHKYNRVSRGFVGRACRDEALSCFDSGATRTRLQGSSNANDAATMSGTLKELTARAVSTWRCFANRTSESVYGLCDPRLAAARGPCACPKRLLAIHFLGLVVLHEWQG